MKKRIYIAGPMRGIPHFNFPAFDSAKYTLEKAGWDVISPADMDRKRGFEGVGMTGFEEIPDIEMEEIIKSDIQAIFDSDAIFMLTGWENSTGATAEHALAIWLKKEIIHQ